MKELSAFAMATMAIALLVKYVKYRKLSASSRRKVGFGVFDFYRKEYTYNTGTSLRHRYMELANLITVSICICLVLLLISIIGMLAHFWF
jgi:lipoprotein signal peptidase